MSTIKYIFLIISLSSIIFGCAKFDSPSGNLNVSVKDDFGNAVKGQDVYVYTNEADMQSEAKKHYAWKITDTSGLATFKNLEIQTYWLYCKYEKTDGEIVKLSDSVTIILDKYVDLELKP